MFMKGIVGETFDKMIANLEHTMKDLPMMKKIVVLERDSNGLPTLMYYLMKMTMMSLRESVIRLDRIPQPDGRILYVSTSTEHPDYPVTDKIIRMDAFKVTMVADVPG